MKKLVFFFTFVLFASFGYANVSKTNTNSITENQSSESWGCLAYAIQSTYAEIEAFGPMSSMEFVDALAWYYNACEESDGSIMSPVFIGDE